MSETQEHTGPAPTRVLVANSFRLAREAISDAVAHQASFKIVGEAANVVELEEAARATQPDVVALDASFDGGVVEATTAVLRAAPGCSVLILDQSADTEVLYRTVLAGARGYLTGGYSLDGLVEGMQMLSRGEALIPEGLLTGLLARLVNRQSEVDEARKIVGGLTSREREVLRLVVDGQDNHSIGRSLVISPQTARTHVQNVLSKLGVHSRLEAAAFVLRHDMSDELVVQS
jgi:DNA-binding NarL/FixJ family response regulator